MGSQGPIEPSADTREAAAAVRRIFAALVDEGFTEDQALKITGQVLMSALAHPSTDPDG